MSKSTSSKPKQAKGTFSAVKPSNYAARLMDSLGWGRKLKQWRALEAVRAGLLALIIKDTEAHGNFQKWWAAKSESVSDLTPQQMDNVGRSLRNYMRLASAFLMTLDLAKREGLNADRIARSGWLNAIEPMWVSGLEEQWGRCPLYQAILNWIDGRALMEIYQKEGILKAEADGGQHNATKLSKEEREQLEFTDLCKSVDQLSGTLATHLQAGTLAKLPLEQRWRLAEATLPTLAMIAETTSELSTVQLKALAERLTTITGNIRERLKTGSRSSAVA